MANVIRDRKADLLRVFAHTIDQCADELDRNPDLTGAPVFLGMVNFAIGFGHG